MGGGVLPGGAPPGRRRRRGASDDPTRGGGNRSGRPSQSPRILGIGARRPEPRRGNRAFPATSEYGRAEPPLAKRKQANPNVAHETIAPLVPLGALAVALLDLERSAR